MEYIPERPSHCEGCPSYCSRPKMTFRYLQGTQGDTVEFDDNVIHLVYVTKGRISVIGDLVPDNFIVYSNNFILIPKYLKCTIIALDDVEGVIQDESMSFFVCEQHSFDMATIQDIQDQYRYHALEMREPLMTCIKMISLLIKDGVLCNHMILSNMQMISLIYKHYYSVPELTLFFYPIFNKRTEFVIKVSAAAQVAHNVKSLAELGGYSLSNFKILFKEHFGETPYTYLVKRKKELIRMRLQDTETPIKVLVDEFGFSDQSHLNNFCKRYMGGTALQVRNHLNNERPQEIMPVADY